jgi:hypothetical protein
MSLFDFEPVKPEFEPTINPITQVLDKTKALESCDIFGDLFSTPQEIEEQAIDSNSQDEGEDFLPLF